MGLLMKCANCKKDAFYIYQLTENAQILYCNTHLPKFLEQAKKAGLLKTTEALKSVLEEGFKKITNTPLVEPEVEETPVAEPTPTPTPTPTKKPTKKAATKNDTNS
jgi:cell division septation protein DedD